MRRLIIYLCLPFALAFAGKNSLADQELCKIRVTTAQIAAATAAPLNPADEKVVENRSFEAYWMNSTCTALIVAKTGKDEGGIRKVSVIYVQNRSMADQKVDHQIVPIQADGSFAVAGVGTCRPEPVVKFVYEGNTIRAHCGGFSLLLNEVK